jgi:hypothetical protein
MPGVFAGLKRFARIQTNGLVLKVARIPECFQREVEFRSIKVHRKKFRETAAAIFVKKSKEVKTYVMSVFLGISNFHALS